MAKSNGRDAVVVAFVDAYSAAENGGSKIAQTCAIARTTYKGTEVPDEDVEYITGKIAESRGWEGATAKTRKSEVRKVLTVYSTLPEAIEAVREREGSCDWRDGMRLATLLKKNGGKVRAALSAFQTQETKKVSPQGRAAGALKAWYKLAKGDKRGVILKAAELLGLKLGIKVEA